MCPSPSTAIFCMARPYAALSHATSECLAWLPCAVRMYRACRRRCWRCSGRSPGSARSPAPRRRCATRSPPCPARSRPWSWSSARGCSTGCPAASPSPPRAPACSSTRRRSSTGSPWPAARSPPCTPAPPGTCGSARSPPPTPRSSRAPSPASGATRPEVRLTLIEGVTGGLLAALLAGDADVVLVTAGADRPFDDARFATHHVLDEPVLLAVRRPATRLSPPPRPVRLASSGVRGVDRGLGGPGGDPAGAERAARVPAADRLRRGRMDREARLRRRRPGVTLVPALAARAAPPDVRLLALHPDEVPPRSVLAATIAGRTVPPRRHRLPGRSCARRRPLPHPHRRVATPPRARRALNPLRRRLLPALRVIGGRSWLSRQPPVPVDHGGLGVRAPAKGGNRGATGC